MSHVSRQCGQDICSIQSPVDLEISSSHPKGSTMWEMELARHKHPVPCYMPSGM